MAGKSCKEAVVQEFEAEDALGALLDRVERGEEIVITRHGRAVALLAPYVGASRASEARAAAERIRARSAGLNRGFSWEDFKCDRASGRP